MLPRRLTSVSNCIPIGRFLQVLGCAISEKDQMYYNELKEAVITVDIMLDKLIIKDVQLTAANDDNYFVFEDQIYNIMLCFSRDTEVRAFQKHGIVCIDVIQS